jgi:hypothetical protein
MGVVVPVLEDQAEGRLSKFKTRGHCKRGAAPVTNLVEGIRADAVMNDTKSVNKMFQVGCRGCFSPDVELEVAQVTIMEAIWQESFEMVLSSPVQAPNDDQSLRRTKRV